MGKGRIIFLNGVTSAGKTSIVEAFQERDDIFALKVDTSIYSPAECTDIIVDKLL